MCHCAQAWKDWFDTDAPEEEAIPDGYSTSIDLFHKLLLVRSWCPDRCIPMAKLYIADAMGKEVNWGGYYQIRCCIHSFSCNLVLISLHQYIRVCKITRAYIYSTFTTITVSLGYTHYY